MPAEFNEDLYLLTNLVNDYTVDFAKPITKFTTKRIIYGNLIQQVRDIWSRIESISDMLHIANNLHILFDFMKLVEIDLRYQQNRRHGKRKNSTLNSPMTFQRMVNELSNLEVILQHTYKEQQLELMVLRIAGFQV